MASAPGWWTSTTVSPCRARKPPCLWARWRWTFRRRYARSSSAFSMTGCSPRSATLPWPPPISPRKRGAPDGPCPSLTGPALPAASEERDLPSLSRLRLGLDLAAQAHRQAAGRDRPRGPPDQVHALLLRDRTAAALLEKPHRAAGGEKNMRRRILSSR